MLLDIPMGLGRFGASSLQANPYISEDTSHRAEIISGHYEDGNKRLGMFLEDHMGLFIESSVGALHIEAPSFA